MPNDDELQVRGAVDRWFAVLNAMLNGNAEPFAALYSHKDDVTYMGAEGTYRVGFEAAYTDWQAQAEKSTGGAVEGADIQLTVGGDMATAAHITKGSVKQSNGDVEQTVLRETSVFRKEDGEWRMIGHHADVIPAWAKAFK